MSERTGFVDIDVMLTSGRPLDPATCAEIVRSRRWASKVVEVPSGCVEWTASKNSKGYGSVWACGGTALAHRVSWVASNQSDIPDGFVVDHLCRNRACVNPDHLEPVVQRENVLRGVAPAALQAKRELCIRGHRLTTFPSGRPGRYCPTCAKDGRLIIARARRALGISHLAYIGKYGASVATAIAIITDSETST